MARRIVIDHEVCTLAGECVYNHPRTFGWDDDDRPVVLRPALGPGDDDDALAAAAAVAGCPSGAITVVDT